MALEADAIALQCSGDDGRRQSTGEPKLREACAAWVQRRYGVTLDAATQVLPVIGSREALFSLAQTVIDPTRPGATVVCPNPFYQIYEGAALLAGIGFTMSIFITSLAYADAALVTSAKLGILGGSLVSATLGALWLRFVAPSRPAPPPLDSSAGSSGGSSTRSGAGPGAQVPEPSAV